MWRPGRSSGPSSPCPCVYLPDVRLRQGHSAGPEPDPAMAAVAARLAGRRAAPAQRHPSVLPDQRVVLTEDRDVAADEQRAVRALLYRGLLRHRLLRPAVQAA